MMWEIMEGTLQKSKSGPLTASFRLWPIDMDVYGHMNNANYFRVAELARWRQTAQSGLLPVSIRERYMFLIAEQSVRYYKPIMPLQCFVVRSEMSTEGKWIHYDHYFQSDASAQAKVFAHIKMKAVVKLPSGLTVLPEEVLSKCPGIRAWFAQK